MSEAVYYFAKKLKNNNTLKIEIYKNYQIINIYFQYVGTKSYS